jgi:hypothetical protein
MIKKEKLSSIDLEKNIANLHYSSYENWVKNFALNLNQIWKDSSAKKFSNINFHTDSALVIGRGPSLLKHNHLELLKNSNFKGSIICPDGSLKTVLEHGVTPDLFPNFYVISIEPYSRIKKLYQHKIIKKYGKKIQGIFPTIASPDVINEARKNGIKINWLHLLFDYKRDQPSFNQISALMVRAKKHFSGLPAIQTGGNAGTAAWFFSWQILKCKKIGLIGMNHGWDEDDPLEKILSGSPELIHEIKDSKKLEKMLIKLYNPEFQTYCLLDPIFNFYRSALLEFISRSPKSVLTINASEGGSIFGNRVKCMKFYDFLTEYS